jgi:hypothetical protein
VDAPCGMPTGCQPTRETHLCLESAVGTASHNIRLSTLVGQWSGQYREKGNNALTRMYAEPTLGFQNQMPNIEDAIHKLLCHKKAKTRYGSPYWSQHGFFLEVPYLADKELVLNHYLETLDGHSDRGPVETTRPSAS